MCLKGIFADAQRSDVRRELTELLLGQRPIFVCKEDTDEQTALKDKAKNVPEAHEILEADESPHSLALQII